jgi:hypothetical protein
MSNQTTEELLLAGMERFTADVTPPSGLAVRAARHRRRRRIATAAAGAAATAGAVLAGVAVAGPVPAAPGGQQAQTAAYVVSRTESAVAAVSSQDLVESDRVTTYGSAVYPLDDERVGRNLFLDLFGFSRTGAGRSAVWVYGQQFKVGDYTSSGQLASIIGIAADQQQVQLTTVDYQKRTWHRSTWRQPGQLHAPEPGCANTWNLHLFAQGDVVALRMALSCGDYTVAGTQRVDGVEAVELKPAPSARMFAVTFWVDPATYLPVRSVVTEKPNAAASPAGRVQIDYQWLAPTPANVAELDVTIPPGFTEVKAPR